MHVLLLRFEESPIPKIDEGSFPLEGRMMSSADRLGISFALKHYRSESGFWETLKYICIGPRFSASIMAIINTAD